MMPKKVFSKYFKAGIYSRIISFIGKIWKIEIQLPQHSNANLKKKTVTNHLNQAHNEIFKGKDK